jgi:hypothetical protein
MQKTIYAMCLVLSLAILRAFTLNIFAQTQGEITGVITDASGAAVPGVTVTVTNVATGATRQVISNEAGVYNFPALQPGVYNIRVEQPGFKPVTRSHVPLEIQQTARIDFSLEIGSVDQAINVEGSAPLLTTEDTTLGTVIENKRIVDLPLNGRNFLQLVATAPNVSFGFSSAGQAESRQGGTRSQQNISIAGQRSMFNRFSIDGIENTDVNFNTPIILPSIDALQEFKVQHGIFPAEFGRATSQINVLTKSGTNELHGALFEFLRNDAMDARIYDFTGTRAPDAKKEPFKWNQYGFTVGGPVWLPKKIFGPLGYDGRERLFFLSNFEGFRERKTLRGLYDLPLAAWREGDFSVRSNQIFDPATRVRGPDGTITAQPFQGNRIPRNRIHTTSLKLLEFYPAPNTNPGGLVANYETGQNRRIDKDQYTQRIDFIESARSNWFGRFSWGDEQQVQPALYLNGTKLLTNVRQIMLSNTRVFGPTKVNDLRFGYNYFSNLLGTELANVRDVVGELRIPGVSPSPSIAWGIPSIGVASFSGFGDSSEGPYVNKNHIYQLSDNFSWTVGSHSFRFGGEVRWDQYNQIGNQFARGSFIFEPVATQNPDPRAPAGTTGNAFADFLLGLCRRCEASVALATVRFRAQSLYFYIDDTWKLHPKLTLSLGLRYEYTPPWFDKNGTLVNIHVPFVDTTPNVQDLSRHPTFVRIGSGDFYEGIPLRFNPAIKVARDGRLGKRLVASDYKDFAPRFGLAWSPTSTWTIRTGAGVFYSQDTGNPRFDMARNLAGRRRDESNADFPDLTWDQPFRNLGGTVQINNPYVLGNIYRRRTPYVLQYMLNVQRELGRQAVLEVGYLGSVSRRLESLRAFNESIPGATGSVLSRAPYPEFGRIQEVDGSGKGHYNALSAKLQKRYSQGLSWLAGYTWSRSIDTASAIRNHDGDTLFPQNSYNLAAERALSSFHVAHRFVSSVLYELPFGAGRRFLNTGGVANAVLGGWEFSSIFAIQTGFPRTVMVGRDQSNTGAGFDRPNATGQQAELPRGERNPQSWFNTAAFILPPFGSHGNVGRNTVIGPGLIQLDTSLLKSFRFAETRSLQFRFEAFNAPNHPNWGNPNTTFISSSFGKILSTRTTMRELQFGLKFIF